MTSHKQTELFTTSICQMFKAPIINIKKTQDWARRKGKMRKKLKLVESYVRGKQFKRIRIVTIQ